jgi:hypothetical protein
MATLYVARSTALTKWGSDVGLSKHIYKIGVTGEPVKALVASGWAGETDWKLLGQEEADDSLTEALVVERLAKREKLVHPQLYPRIKGTNGIFKVLPAHVENHIIVTRALSGGAERIEIKLKPADFAAFLIHNAKR